MTGMIVIITAVVTVPRDLAAMTEKKSCVREGKKVVHCQRIAMIARLPALIVIGITAAESRVEAAVTITFLPN